MPLPNFSRKSAGNLENPENLFRNNISRIHRKAALLDLDITAKFPRHVQHLLTYLVIKDYKNAAGAFPSLTKMTYDLKTSRSRISSGIKSLQEEKIVAKRTGDATRSNIYVTAPIQVLSMIAGSIDETEFYEAIGWLEKMQYLIHDEVERGERNVVEVLFLRNCISNGKDGDDISRHIEAVEFSTNPTENNRIKEFLSDSLEPFPKRYPRAGLFL